MNKLLLPLMGAFLAMVLASCSGKTVTETITGGGTASGTVSGKVVDKKGVGISGVKISIGDVSALTDASGAFAIDKVPGGMATTAPSKSGYYFLPTTQDVTVDKAQVTIKYSFIGDTSSFGNTGHGGTRGYCAQCH